MHRIDCGIDTSPSPRRLSQHVLAGLGVVLLAMTLAGPCRAGANDGASARSDPRMLGWNGTSEGLDRLRLRAGNGALRVRAGDSEEIRIRLRIEKGYSSDDEWSRGVLRWFFHSSYENDDALKEAVTLEVSRSGSTLTVSPRPHGRSRERKLEESWEIEVPRRFAVDLEMASAEVEVTDLEGGVDLELGHGKAEVDVPKGPLHLEVTVGKIDARTGFEALGDISVSSRVGDARVWWDGKRVRAHRPPGPGSAVEVPGRGTEQVVIRVEVGDAGLRVE